MPAMAQLEVTMTMLVASLAAGGSEAYAEKMAILIACGLISGRW